MDNAVTIILLVLLAISLSVFFQFTTVDLLQQARHEPVEIVAASLTGYSVESNVLRLYFVLRGGNNAVRNVSVYVDNNLVDITDCNPLPSGCVLETAYPRYGGEVTVVFPNGARFRMWVPPRAYLEIREVNLPPFFEVNVTADINITVCNEGKDTVTDDVLLLLDSNEQNRATVTLQAGECSTITLSFLPDSGGDRVLEVRTGGSSVIFDIFVNAIYLPYSRMGSTHKLFLFIVESITAGTHSLFFSITESIHGGTHTLFYSIAESIHGGVWDCPDELNCYVT